MMRHSIFRISLVAGAMGVAAVLAWPNPMHAADADNPANDACLNCHGNESFSAQTAEGKTRSLYVEKDRFGKSVHGNRTCTECHTDITETPHKAGTTQKVNCVTCHDALWKAAQAAGTTQENARLGVVVQQIDHYLNSVHARSRRDDPGRTNATCYDCHAALHLP